MLMIAKHLKQFAEDHPDLVSIRQSDRYPLLYVVKYKRKVFYKNLWTPELREMRGLVVDKDWNVVVRPFDKIFNRGENEADFPLDEVVCAVRKINGFMAGITRTDEHGLIISTTGSLDSPFVTLAEKYLLPLSNRGMINGVTYLFEIVDETDPHIIEEIPGAYLIGARAVCSKIQLYECDLDEVAKGLGAMRPEWKITTFDEVVEEVKHVKHEGFCVYNMMYEGIKIKSPYYLIKKFFMRCNPEKITCAWLIRNRETFDEEFYGLIDHIVDNCAKFFSMVALERRLFIERYLEGEL